MEGSAEGVGCVEAVEVSVKGAKGVTETEVVVLSVWMPCLSMISLTGAVGGSGFGFGFGFIGGSLVPIGIDFGIITGLSTDDFGIRGLMTVKNLGSLGHRI